MAYQTMAPDWANEPNVRIYKTMFESPAWKLLSGRQRALYFFCLSQYNQLPYNEYPDIAALDPRERAEYFNANKALIIRTTGLYGETNQQGVYEDLKALCAKGFIFCHKRGGQYAGVKAIYRFSEEWKKIGREK